MEGMPKRFAAEELPSVSFGIFQSRSVPLLDFEESTDSEYLGAGSGEWYIDMEKPNILDQDATLAQRIWED